MEMLREVRALVPCDLGVKSWGSWEEGRSPDRQEEWQLGTEQETVFLLDLLLTFCGDAKLAGLWALSSSKTESGSSPIQPARVLPATAKADRPAYGHTGVSFTFRNQMQEVMHDLEVPEIQMPNFILYLQDKSLSQKCIKFSVRCQKQILDKEKTIC